MKLIILIILLLFLAGCAETMILGQFSVPEFEGYDCIEPSEMLPHFERIICRQGDNSAEIIIFDTSKMDKPMSVEDMVYGYHDSDNRESETIDSGSYQLHISTKTDGKHALVSASCGPYVFFIQAPQAEKEQSIRIIKGFLEQCPK